MNTAPSAVVSIVSKPPRQLPKTGPKVVPFATAQFIIAMTVVVGFIVLLIIPLVECAYGTISESEAADLVKTVAAVFGGAVGAVTAFYFATAKRELPPG